MSTFRFYICAHLPDARPGPISHYPRAHLLSLLDGCFSLGLVHFHPLLQLRNARLDFLDSVLEELDPVLGFNLLVGEVAYFVLHTEPIHIMLLQNDIFKKKQKW